jgi:hypothetical protein
MNSRYGLQFRSLTAITRVTERGEGLQEGYLFEFGTPQTSPV